MAIESVGIIGGGVMGSGIAQSLAVGGVKVTIRDVNDAKNRIVATVDASGNRSAVTKDVS